jgi:hypothetical protein
MFRSRISSVGIATDCGMDGRDWIPDRGKTFFSIPQCPGKLWCPPNLLYNEYRWILPWGLSNQGRETDHSPSSSAEVKNGGAIRLLLHMSTWRRA